MAKKWLTKSISVFLVVVMFMTAAPLSGFVGLELPEVLSTMAMMTSGSSGTYYYRVMYNCVDDQGDSDVTFFVRLFYKSNYGATNNESYIDLFTGYDASLRNRDTGWKDSLGEGNFPTRVQVYHKRGQGSVKRSYGCNIRLYINSLPSDEGAWSSDNPQARVDDNICEVDISTIPAPKPRICNIINNNKYDQYGVLLPNDFEESECVSQDIASPSGYNFSKDSFNFENYGTLISKEYFTTLYGAEKGKLLYNKKKWVGLNGVCFGITNVTASLYNNLPECKSKIRNLINSDFIYGILGSLSSSVSIDNNYVSIHDYINYSFITQWSSDCQFLASKNNSIFDIADYIKAYIDENDTIGVTIGLRHNSDGGHAVLAVGTEGNDILIDDPNDKNELQRITVNDDGTWEFSNPWTKQGVNNNNTSISLTSNYDLAYSVLSTGSTINVKDNVSNSETNSLITERYVNGNNKLDEDKILMYVDSDNYQLHCDNYTEIKYDCATTNIDNEYTGDLYWLHDDKEITVTNTDNDENTIVMAGEENTIKINSFDNSKITITMDEEKNDISTTINSEKNGSHSITFETTDDNSNDIVITVTGASSNANIEAKKSKEGIEVSGLDSLNIEYDTKNGTDSMEINNAAGKRVNIIVDENSSKITAEVDNNKENDSNCSCICHSTGLVGFVYKIIRIFWKLFKTNKTCACGVAHY